MPARAAPAAAMELYAPEGHRSYINEDERRRFIAAALGVDYPKRQFGLLLALTGCRLSEGRGFRLDDLQASVQRVFLRTRTLDLISTLRSSRFGETCFEAQESAKFIFFL